LLYEKIRDFFKHSIIFGLGGFAGRLIGFFLIPIYTNIFTPADYGILTLLQVTSKVLSIILNFGIRQAISRIYYNNENEDYRKTVISTNIYFLITIPLIFTCILIYYSKLFSIIIFNNSEYQHYIIIVLISAFLGILQIIPQRINRIKLHSKKYVYFQLINLLIGLSSSIYLVVYKKMGIEGSLYAGLFTTLVLLLLMTPILIENMNFKFSYPILIQSLKYGLPYIPHGIASFALFGIDRYFLNYYGTLDDVGLYSLSYKFTLIVTLFMNAMQNTWTPYRNDLMNKKDGFKIINLSTTYFFMIMSIVSIIVSSLSKEVLLIMANENFLDAYKITPILCVSYLIYSGYFTFGTSGIAKMMASKWVPLSSFVALIINVIFNYLLVPDYGSYGAAFATLISYLVMTSISYYISNRLFYIEYEWNRIFAITIFSIFIIIINFYVFNDISIVKSILFKSLTILIGLITILYGLLLRKDEKDIIVRMINTLITSRKDQ
jgi:O-antigen/teichoic acid export membrane protein